MPPDPTLIYGHSDEVKAGVLKRCLFILAILQVIVDGFITIYSWFSPAVTISTLDESPSRTDPDLALYLLSFLLFVLWVLRSGGVIRTVGRAYEWPRGSIGRGRQEYFRQQRALFSALTGNGGGGRAEGGITQELATAILRRGEGDFRGTDFEELNNGLVDRGRDGKVDKERLDIVAPVTVGDEEEAGICSVCMEGMGGKEVRVLSGCGHTFCKVCIERWCVGEGRGECPICKEEI